MDDLSKSYALGSIPVRVLNQHLLAAVREQTDLMFEARMLLIAKKVIEAVSRGAQDSRLLAEMFLDAWQHRYGKYQSCTEAVPLATAEIASPSPPPPELSVQEKTNSSTPVAPDVDELSGCGTA